MRTGESRSSINSRPFSAGIARKKRGYFNATGEKSAVVDTAGARVSSSSLKFKSRARGDRGALRRAVRRSGSMTILANLSAGSRPAADVRPALHSRATASSPRSRPVTQPNSRCRPREPSRKQPQRLSSRRYRRSGSALRPPARAVGGNRRRFGIGRTCASCGYLGAATPVRRLPVT